MKCPVIDYHKNRSLKWWIKYILAWIVGMASTGIIQFEDIDKWVNKSNKTENQDE